ncbi:MAG: DAK2 domain-containing protein [Clostridia bacterium]|nr:DAK2 domain-containing protein [Clostridia bacterium]
MSSARASTTYITVAGMKNMLMTGKKLLDVNKAQVDALNVFPVPDGDTGTNMSLTMTSACKQIENVTNTQMSTLANELSKGALRGARGNSGVILSQILKGFSSVIANCEEIDTKTFAKGLKKGAELAYSAVSKPKEGTILTVIRCMAEEAVEVAKRTSNVQSFLEKVLEKGEIVLQQTPDMLEVLKRAGVVDSGGFGLLTLFKGFLMGYLGQEVEGATEAAAESKPQANVEDSMDSIIDFESLDDIDFGYCTEFVIINMHKKTTLTDIDKLRNYLNEIGNSTIVIGDLSMVKVHVHTNNPGKALAKALTLGEIDKIKIENMMEQNRQLRAKYEAERKNIGVLSICNGDGLSAIFKDLLVDQVIEGGQTMNPSADDIATAVRKINAENVIILPNNSNIILSAEQSRTLIKNRNIFVLPTKEVTQGITAMLSYNPDAPLADNLKEMTAAIKTVESGEVTYAVRDTQIGNLKIKKGNIIGIYAGEIVCCGKSVEAVTTQLIEKMLAKGGEVVSLYYGKDVSQVKAEEFGESLEEKFPDAEVFVRYGGQPLYYFLVSVE